MEYLLNALAILLLLSYTILRVKNFKDNQYATAAASKPTTLCLQQPILRGVLAGIMNQKPKTINIMLLDGGVGDHIASLVAIHYIMNRYPWITPLIWVPDFLVEFARNVLNKKSSIKGFSDLQRYYDPNLTTKTTKWDGVFSPMKIHCLDYAFLKLCDENPDITHKNYLKVNFNPIDALNMLLPDKYIVCTTGFTADVREWPAVEVNKTVAYAKSRGYETIFLGQTQTTTGVAHTITGSFREEIDFKAGINLIDKTSLLQATAIMQDSKAVLGVDNGLLHVAGCTDATIIGGFTTVSPEIRMPIRNNILGWNYKTVVPDQSLACKFCQQTTNFLYGHDYRNCLYNDNRKNVCTTQMTAEKFIGYLENIL